MCHPQIYGHIAAIRQMTIGVLTSLQPVTGAQQSGRAKYRGRLNRGAYERQFHRIRTIITTGATTLHRTVTVRK